MRTSVHTCVHMPTRTHACAYMYTRSKVLNSHVPMRPRTHAPTDVWTRWVVRINLMHEHITQCWCYSQMTARHATPRAWCVCVHMLECECACLHAYVYMGACGVPAYGGRPLLDCMNGDLCMQARTLVRSLARVHARSIARVHTRTHAHACKYNATQSSFARMHTCTHAHMNAHLYACMLHACMHRHACMHEMSRL